MSRFNESRSWATVLSKEPDIYNTPCSSRNAPLTQGGLPTPPLVPKPTWTWVIWQFLWLPMFSHSEFRREGQALFVGQRTWSSKSKVRSVLRGYSRVQMPNWSSKTIRILAAERFRLVMQTQQWFPSIQGTQHILRTTQRTTSDHNGQSLRSWSGAGQGIRTGVMPRSARSIDMVWWCFCTRNTMCCCKKRRNKCISKHSNSHLWFERIGAP